MAAEDRDYVHYFKMTSFMISVLRHRAYAVHREAEKKANEEAKSAQESKSVNDLFNTNKISRRSTVATQIKLPF